MHTAVNKVMHMLKQGAGPGTLSRTGIILNTENKPCSE